MTKKWETIRLSKNGPPISHLFFVNDLILLCKVDLTQATVLIDIINQNFHFSGHKVNACKTQIYFSSNTTNPLKTQICSFLGYQMFDHLGKYLGVPLFHSRKIKNTYHFVVDKVYVQLNGWDAKLLSLAGWITLVRSVLIVIPNYFMQTVLVLVFLREEIEINVRNFVWGSTDVHENFL